ncbi:hypothetical protein LY78DRAFT_201610 [Colletotrichum sublineola]|nr:hypothetical protein LY78DRAFT_201610 [Colletotrichum sublineola]
MFHHRPDRQACIVCNVTTAQYPSWIASPACIFTRTINPPTTCFLCHLAPFPLSFLPRLHQTVPHS